MRPPDGSRLECYRCGRRIEPGRLGVEGWVVLHAWDDGSALFVCPDCQSEREAERAVALVADTQGLRR